MKNSLALIQKLCSAFAPSGCEGEVADLIKKEISDVCSDIHTDKMGNLIAVMRFGDLSAKQRTRIMMSAHMDEVGFMITEIKSDGYLAFDTVGGINASVLAGKRVKVISQSGLLNGVIASKAIHHKDKKERQKATEVDKLYIDIGARDAERASALVRIGDFATFDSEFYCFGEELIKAKAIDDRIGCAAMIEAMRELKISPPTSDIDVFFCFTVREEIGLSGAKAAAYAIRPDYAVVLETTAVADIADTPPAKRVADIGNGVAVSFMDRSTVYDRELTDKVLSIADKNGVKAQIKRYVSGGNDAGAIHKTAEGVKTVTLSVPTRYLHSPASVANINDYFAQRDLCVCIFKELV